MNRKFGRTKAHRNHTLRNLAASLVVYEQIDTTEAKAKEIKSIVDALIARAKDNSLESKRRLFAYFFDKNAAHKVINELLPRYANRQSGFVKSYRLRNRLGDNSPMMRLVLVDHKVFVDENQADVEKSDKSESKEEANTTTTVKTKVRKNG